MRSFNWVTSLSETPKLFFNKWSLFKYAMEQSIKDRPFYEYGVFRGDSDFSLKLTKSVMVLILYWLT